MFMLTVVFPVYIIVRGILRKEYRYIPVSILMFLLLAVQSLSQKPEFMFAGAYMGIAEKVILAALTGVLIFCAFPDWEGKRHPVPPILTGAALVIRVIRTIVFDWNIERIAMQGSKALQEFSLYLGLMDTAIRVLLFAMLVCVVWQLRKEKSAVE